MKLKKPAHFKPRDPRKPKWAQPEPEEEPAVCETIRRNIEHWSRTRANAGAQIASLQESIRKRAPVINDLANPLDYFHLSPPPLNDPKLDPEPYSKWLRPIVSALQRVGVVGGLLSLFEGARTTSEIQRAINRLEAYRDDLIARNEAATRRVRELRDTIRRTDRELERAQAAGRGCRNLGRSFISWPSPPPAK